MTCIRQTMQIGQALVRTFGKGTSTRHVITQSTAGGTVTRLLDYEGNMMLQRVKKISKYSLGDKKVTEIQRLNTENLKYEPKLDYSVARVYGKDGKLLGSRRENYDFYGIMTTSEKLDAQGNGYVKKFYHCTIGKNRVTYKSSVENFKKGSEGVPFNERGLPIPSYTKEGCYDLSLQEMLKSHISNNGSPDNFYPKGLGFDKIELDASRVFDPVKYMKNMNWWG